MEQTINLILKEIQKMSNRMTAIENNLATQDQDLAAINNRLDHDLSAIHSRLDQDFATINNRLDQDLPAIHNRLDHITKQVARNTEQEVKLQDIKKTVIEHDIDIRMLKKMMTT